MGMATATGMDPVGVNPTSESAKLPVKHGEFLFNIGLIAVLSPTALPIRVVTVVALCTGCACQGLRMAIAAGGATMVDTTPPFIGNARVRTVIFRKPITCAVALRAVQAEHAGMEDRVSMTARACRGYSGELPGGVTFLASCSRMSAGQGEVAAAVIEGGIFPTGGVMTGRTVRAKLPVVPVILLMARVTICWRAFELLVDMT
jgi:hypothetical protein